MELTFHSRDEFEDFARTYMAGVDARKGGVTIGELRVDVRPDINVDELVASLTGDANPLAEAARELEGFNADGNEQNGATPAAAEPTPGKRKRRTKAEIVADEAAAAAAQTSTDEPVLTPEERTALVETSTPSEPADTFDKVSMEQPAAPADPKAALDAHVANITALGGYTPEVRGEIEGNAVLFDADRLAHMNEARAAIARKQFPAYQATMTAFGLPASIATYTDEQVKLHRSAIAHLMAQE